MFEGSVDQVTTTNATGWLYDRTAGRAADVLAVLHGRVIGSAPSILHRPDLEDVGFGDGLCGFDLPFDEPVRDCDLPFVTVQPRGSNLSIPRTSADSYKDFIAQATRLHPGAGRSRTVLGGLWTDRTDSLQILAGRVNTGSCSAEAREGLRSLIAEGQVAIEAAASTPLLEEVARTLEGGSGPDLDSGSRHAAASALADAMVTEELGLLLAAAFDDAPIAYAFRSLAGDAEEFAQASTFEPFTSPAELVVVYVPVGEAPGGRLDYVRDSHEFPEFAPTGGSRWTGEDPATLPLIVAGREQPIDSVDLVPGRSVVVGPGLIHRVSPASPAGLLRVTFAPKRNTPVRFLKGDSAWQDVALGHGVRARLG